MKSLGSPFRVLDQPRRSPCGERGLKYDFLIDVNKTDMSLPVRGAWIEIIIFCSEIIAVSVAPRAGSVD